VIHNKELCDVNRSRSLCIVFCDVIEPVSERVHLRRCTTSHSETIGQVLLALGGESYSSCRGLGSDSSVQLYQWTHCRIKATLIRVFMKGIRFWTKLYSYMPSVNFMYVQQSNNVSIVMDVGLCILSLVGNTLKYMKHDSDCAGSVFLHFY
jgi:hypothetical protein